MKKFTYYAPTEIIFGENAEDRTAEFVKKYGGTRVLVIYGGQSAVRSGLIAKIEANLKEAGLEVLSAGGVVPNPHLSTARNMAEQGKAFKADFVLAVGGGSVIDTAKGVAHGIANPDNDIWDFWCGKARVTKSLPIGSVLTISAAGSETSCSAVLTNDDKLPWTKRGLNSDFHRCKFAIMDPLLTMSLPKWQVGAGVADIFMHTSERYFPAILGNHLTDEIAEGLFRTIIKYGKMGVDDASNYEAMSEIMWCGSVSHVGLTGIGTQGDTSRDGDWSCHQLGMAISAIYDYTHGATLTAVWGSWARYVLHVNVARFAQLARKVYGVTIEDDAAAAEAGIVKTEEFFKSLGMPISLTELFGREITEEDIKALTDECSWGHTRTIGSFTSLDDKDMEAIFRKSV